MPTQARSVSPFLRLQHSLLATSLSALLPFPGRGSQTLSGLILDLLARESDVTVSFTATPHAEYKGFAIHILSGLFLACWLLWTFVPTRVLHACGIYYYPLRWWAVAIPSYILMAMAFTYLGLILYYVEVATDSLGARGTLLDRAGIVQDNAAEFIHTPTSGVRDMPISLVNQVLYDTA